MLCGCHYKIFANLEWAFQMRKGVKQLSHRIKNTFGLWVAGLHQLFVNYSQVSQHFWRPMMQVIRHDAIFGVKYVLA